MLNIFGCSTCHPGDFFMTGDPVACRIDFPEVWQLQVGALLLPRVPEGSLEGAQEEVPKKTFRNSACWENLLVVATTCSY